MTLDDGAPALTGLEKLAVLLFGGFAALIVLPSFVFIAVSIFSTGAIDLGH